MSNIVDTEYKIYQCDCGKKFIPTPNYLYKIKTTYYCSYTCYRKVQKEKEKQARVKIDEDFRLAQLEV